MGDKKQRELWTLKELCAYLKVSKSSAYFYVATEKIPSVRIGRHRRFIPDDVERALRKMAP